METYTSVETFTENGNPLFITIKIYIYQDENLQGRLFWTFDILSIKGVASRRGETFDYEVDEKEYKSEIEKACLEELELFKAAA
jgi:hypothetical protein